jgi:phosphomannomutase
MAQENAVFAGEVSGHYYFRDFFYADSGIVPSLFILEMLSKRGVKMSQLLAELENKYFISGEINSKVADPQGRIAALKQRYADGKQETLDGISVTYPDWHFNVRGSNTEPLLRLNLEALTRDEMERRRDEVLAILRA